MRTGKEVGDASPISAKSVTFVTSFSLLILAAGMAPAWVMIQVFWAGFSVLAVVRPTGVEHESPESIGIAPVRTLQRIGRWQQLAQIQQSVSPAPMVSNFNGLPQIPGHDAPAGRWARDRGFTPATFVSGRHRRRPGSDPIRAGRSNDGSQFGMFLQVFADGTVVDSEGVHHLRAADLRSIVDSVQSGELYRVRGHCGAPSTDFIEYVHVVIYERRLGR